MPSLERKFLEWQIRKPKYIHTNRAQLQLLCYTSKSLVQTRIVSIGDHAPTITFSCSVNHECLVKIPTKTFTQTVLKELLTEGQTENHNSPSTFVNSA